MKYKTYKNEYNYSYAIGAFPVYELIESKKYQIEEVFISDKYNEKEALIDRLKKENIQYSINDKQIKKISQKDNVYVMAVFTKKICL